MSGFFPYVAAFVIAMSVIAVVGAYVERARSQRRAEKRREGEHHAPQVGARS